jgi:hypothetical protein
VRTREEKAVAEALALEQKLKLQRVELARQAHAIQNVEDKSKSELYQVQVGQGLCHFLLMRLCKALCKAFLPE